MASTFAAVREATGLQRCSHNHGCGPAEVLPGVWTAHYHDVETAEALKGVSERITVVINCATDKCPTHTGSYGPGVEVLRIEGLLDDPEARKKVDGMPEGPEKEAAKAALPEFPPEECAGDAKKDFEIVIAAMEAAKSSGGASMVHCYASLSRSVAFILAYMMKTERVTLVEAIKRMRTTWDAVWPNDHFVAQLLEYEAELGVAQTPGAASFVAVREATGLQRCPHNHGCGPAEVMPGVWTAHYHDVETADALKGVSEQITVVINCATDKCPTHTGSYGSGVEVLRIEGLLDDPEARKKVDGMPEGPEKEAAKAALPEFPPEECAGDAKKDFETVIAAMDAAKSSGGASMVHCYASLSRSVAFILAYMMKTERVTLVEAIRRMRTTWDAVWPNDHFVTQLLEYEAELGIAETPGAGA